MTENPIFKYLREKIDQKIEEVIEVYLKEISNLDTISGIFAPLSLTLLSVENLDINQLMLLTGFTFLILNILFNRWFLNRRSRKYDQHTVKADFEWVLNSSDFKSPNFDVSEDVTKMFDKHDASNKIEKLLDLGEYKFNLQKDRSDFRNHLKKSNLVFTMGAILIILSVWFNPVATFVFTNFGC